MTPWFSEDEDEWEPPAAPELVVEFVPSEPEWLWTPQGERAVWPKFGFARAVG